MLKSAFLLKRETVLESWGLILRGLFIITAVSDSLVICALFLFYRQTVETGSVLFMTDFGMPYEVAYIFPFLFILNGLLVAWALYSFGNYARRKVHK